MIVKNLTEELTKLGLVCFLRNIAKENGLILNEEALGGKEWQMSAPTSQGTEMIVVSITENDGHIRFLNVAGFFVEKGGKRNKKAIIGREGDRAFSESMMLPKGKLYPATDELFRYYVKVTVDAMVTV